MNKQGNQQPSPSCKPLKEDSDYLIYDDGRLYSKKKNRFLKGKIDNSGYHVYTLAISDKFSESKKRRSKMLYAHRLVAEYFLDNPDNLPYVHHKNEDKLDNRVCNLQWVTPSQNNIFHNNVVKSKKRKPRYKIEDLPGEQWMVFPENPLYSISSCGRVCNNQTNRLLYLDEHQKYTRISLNDRKHYYVHRLVYCVFHNDYDLDGYVVDHIDNNPRNNRLENLQKITPSENNLRQERFNDYPTRE